MKQKTFYRPALMVALTTTFLLCIPFVAMEVSSEVNWSIFDFIVAGVLIFVTGLSYVLLTRSSSHILNRIAVAFAIGSTFFLVWTNLAVGLIGSGPNAANLMYVGVVAIIIIGTFLSHASINKMGRVMFIAAATLVLFAGIQLLSKMYEYPGSGIAEIIGVNGFFTVLFAVSGLLFCYAALKQSRK